jgi:hypothetical protein
MIQYKNYVKKFYKEVQLFLRIKRFRYILNDISVIHVDIASVECKIEHIEHETATFSNNAMFVFL